MSRLDVRKQRVRPTREETSERILAAAIAVFLEQGIAAASVESIVAHAGLTRGAFYSSFANREELVVALLQRHVSSSIERNRRLAENYSDPRALVAAIGSDEGRDQDPMFRTPLLNLELLLYAIRVPEQRVTVSEMLQTLRATVGQIAVSSARQAGVTRHIDAEQVGALLLALEDGFDLHRLIDPGQTPANAYYLALGQLQNLLLDAPRDH
jgi:AcrR family transcriptional regulator